MTKRTSSISETILDINKSTIGEVRADIVQDLSMINITLSLYDKENLDKNKDNIKNTVNDFIKELKEEILESNWKFIFE